MSAQAGQVTYTAQGWEVDSARRELRLRGSPVPISGRAFEIIEILARSAGELVTRDELMNRVWPGLIVGENTLHVHISAIRKALGPDRGLLKTASARGYRLIGGWTPRLQVGATPAAAEPMLQRDERQATNFPMIIAPLIGRSAASRHLRDIVSAYRMVTVTGPGGIGKTTLAIDAARGLLDDFDDGAWLVELASLSNPDLVPSAVAGVLGLKLGGGEISAEVVARAVGGKRLLLMLDNCEHVIDAVANLASVFLGFCQRTTIVATSREVLRIDGENVYRVPPLEVPAPEHVEPGRLLDHSAVELFITRTKTLNMGFAPRDEDFVTIGAICRHLDGIPLAIEFAAASAAMLGIQPVSIGLRDRFALLTAGRRTALPRHRTLRATLDWSYELLPDQEQRLLRRLAVFPAGFTVDAAAAVMTDTQLDVSAVTDGIANLVTKSLVALDKSGNRWFLLETIRSYALEKLVERDNAGAVARYHASYFRNLLAPLATAAGARISPDALARLVREIDNIRAALDWSFSGEGDAGIGIALTAAYAPVWVTSSLMAECAERCTRALRDFEPRTEAGARMRMWL